MHYFTSLSDSYAARTGRPDDVGVIGVALFRRKPEPPPPVSYFDSPPARPQAAARDNAQSAPEAPASSAAASRERALGYSEGSLAKREESRLGTGHGRSEQSQARQVTFERATPQPEEVITLYYDSYQNLVSRGIIVASVPHPREPSPFPARFVPDPPRW